MTVSHQPDNRYNDQNTRDGVRQEAELKADTMTERQGEEPERESEALSGEIEELGDISSLRLWYHYLLATFI